MTIVLKSCYVVAVIWVELAHRAFDLADRKGRTQAHSIMCKRDWASLVIHSVFVGKSTATREVFPCKPAGIIEYQVGDLEPGRAL
ncbi:hypothetical protein [Micromonospora inositola]|uniref:hypothetical protein n=1 Tax=Micromonospora inositola TaxID=47865 RepID=UPI0012FD6914|nr:hypothetical protein [Micromonospora inositola]